ncbi:sarcosine oxidase subunit gamma [Pseudooceanicola marinus]|uniref:sarcosine oxidase subunit gamma n=1 Tax=Pseudooceanicola marinus TaxID=396013 RepID=UPI001CD698D6|nr:sarcosine oxidase subunit gamma family protein [Pseudooceanicola marinus]MCA1334848.1 sarcosine oxidase subunit gamma [Pseudooceanicola marinus]
MSDLSGPTPVLALGGAAFDGYVRVAEEPLRAMFTLRGDLSAKALKNAATGLAAVDMPGQGQVALNGEHCIAWMSPDELLVMTPWDEHAKALGQLDATLTDPALNYTDVSQARALFSLSGPDGLVREVAAKLAPVDLSPAAFPAGSFRRSRIGQVSAAIWMPAPGRIEVVCFRSVADYVFTLLRDAARPGSEVGLFG